MMLLRLITVSISLMLVQAYPSRLKILPGLAFYRTDDGHDDSDSALMDKDRDLLKSMWNIVDKIDNKVPAGQNGLSLFQNPHNDARNEEEEQQERGQHPNHMYRSINGQTQSPSVSAPPGPHGAPGNKIHPLGTPITTINVYSTYPATSVKGEHFSPAFSHVPGFRPGFPGAGSNPNNNNGLTAPAFDPNYEQRKVMNPYEYVQSPDFEPAPGNLPLNQDQYTNPEGRFEIPETQRYDGMNQDNGYGVIPTDQSGESERMQYLVPQHMSEMRPIGEVIPNYRHIPESHILRY